MLSLTDLILIGAIAVAAFAICPTRRRVTTTGNAVSQISRPGLLPFLQYMRLQFSELVISTTVPKALPRKICYLLAPVITYR